MDAEFFQLAQEAVAALQAANQPNWAEVAGLILSGIVGVGQIGLIAWGLRRMGVASEERNRQLDIMEANQQELAQALRQQGAALGQIGQALDRQGAALERQGAMMTEALQGLQQQGRVLEELLRSRA